MPTVPTMKILALTHEHLEDVAAKEMAAILSVKPTEKKGAVVADVYSFESAAKYCYAARSVRKVLWLVEEMKVKCYADLGKISDLSRNEINNLTKGKTFAVRASLDNTDLDTSEVCELAANALHLDAKVNLSNPDVQVFLYINGTSCYLGIDLTGIDIAKRDYRIFTYRDVIKPNVCFAVLMIAGYKKGEVILDPFCGSGTALIEAALFQQDKSPNFYQKDKLAFQRFHPIDLSIFDKLSEPEGAIIGTDKEARYISAAKKNAKIAGVEKSLQFSRTEAEWLETKYPEASMDRIITHPPNLTHQTNQANLEKVYHELFFQAEFLLKKSGTVTLITKTLDLLKKAAEKNKFKVQDERTLAIGNDLYSICTFKR